MIKGIAHVGVATGSLETALHFFRDVLALPCEEVEVVEEQSVKVAVLKAGDDRIELLEPTGAESPVARFLVKRGAGLHHLTLEVDDLPAELARLKTLGVRLIDETARIGASGALIAFIHPESTGGVLIELCQSR